MSNGYEITIRKNIPLYIPLDIKGDFRRIGLEDYEKNNNSNMKINNQEIQYPLEEYKPKILNDSEKLNLIILLVDSLRNDMLTDEIMPNLRNYIDHNGIEFVNHFSGSNGTSNGLFSIFYGLPASYLEFFSKTRIEPNIFKLYKENNYKIKILSSQPLDYWNIRESIFSEVKNNIEDKFFKGSIINDKIITDKGIEFIKKNTNNNFFLMLFYDSPHLPHFKDERFKKFIPDERDANFNPNNKEERINGFNAYKNSANYIDSLSINIFKELEENNLIDNSIIIFTSDHGSEKYEHGHWGHASAFTKEQLKVPFWIYHPNSLTKKIKKITDHHDVVTTIFSLMGEKYESLNHSIGMNMLSDNLKDYHIASGQANWVVYNKNYKINSTIFEGYSYYEITDIDDNPLNDEDNAMKIMNKYIIQSLIDRGKFYK